MSVGSKRRKREMSTFKEYSKKKDGLVNLCVVAKEVTNNLKAVYTETEERLKLLERISGGNPKRLASTTTNSKVILPTLNILHFDPKKNVYSSGPYVYSHGSFDWVGGSIR